MSRKLVANKKLSLARSVAPEDLRCGDYVAVLNVICEYPSFLWCSDAATIPPGDLVRVQYLPPDVGIPWKIKAVCLPFVFLKPPRGKPQSMDVRQTRFVRLKRKYSKYVWKKLKKRKA